MAKKTTTITTPLHLKKIPTIPAKDLEIGCTYFTHTKDMIKILQVDNVNERIQYFNLTEQCKEWRIFKHHTIVSKIR